ncbi:MAG TPA: hypothetical protein PKD91_09995, partial [Bacteroidia bacterium]|nr:hypothetical protein [Bacteroidia bacterium]
MAKKIPTTGETGSAPMKRAMVAVFRKHPTRSLNYKQVSKLLEQHDPVLFAKHLYIDDRSANREILNMLMS